MSIEAYQALAVARDTLNDAQLFPHWKEFSGGRGMWHSQKRDLPALDTQVIGIDDDGDLALWTRTTDGWYVSEKRGNVGHRDVRGPVVWTHIPQVSGR